MEMNLVILAVSCAVLAIALYSFYLSRHNPNGTSSGERSILDVPRPRMDPYEMPLIVGTVEIRELVNHLDKESSAALESAAGLAVSRQNFRLEIEHWLLKLCRVKTFVDLLTNSAIRVEDLVSDLEEALSRFESGNTGTPLLSTGVINLLFEASRVAKANSQETHIAPRHLLYSLVSNSEMAKRIGMSTRLFSNLKSETLQPTQSSPREPASLLVELRQNLLRKLLHDESKVDSLIQFERMKFPQASEAELMQRAIERWERDQC